MNRKNRDPLKLNILSIQKLAENNPVWTGDNVGYSPLHNWVARRLPKPDLCQECKKTPPYDLTNKGVYDRNLKNWEWLCRRCHMLSDGRMNNLLRTSAFGKDNPNWKGGRSKNKEYRKEYNRRYHMKLKINQKQNVN